MRQAVILAGGMATRLGERAAELPKVLQPVAGRPFLDHLLWNLRRHGIDRIVLAAGRLGEQVEAHAKQLNLEGVEVVLSHEHEPLGTGGALANARALLDDEFLVLNGDTLFDVNYLDLALLRRQTGAKAAIALRRLPEVGRYGSVVLDGSLITGFAEKTGHGEGLVSGGVMVLESAALDGCPEGFWQLEDTLLPTLAAQGSLAGREYGGYFVDIGVPDDLDRAQADVAAWRSKPLVIFDRDGVLNEDRGWVHEPEQFAWMPQALEAVKWLNDNGYLVAVVTNQAGIARGMYDEDEYRAFENWIGSQLAAVGAHLDAVYHCPHHPDPEVAVQATDCDCRKPKPGMVLRALEDAQVPPNHALLVGDTDSDMAAAYAAGVSALRYEGGSLLEVVLKAAALLDIDE